MAKEQDKQQQQNLLNVELVPINEQVKIPTSNFRIALEKTQPDVIYKHEQISKRHISFHHVIKLDSTLGNLKFVNKGSKEPIIGMAIPIVMLNDDIKASAEYSKVSIPKRRRSKIITREVDPSEGTYDDEVDYEETEEDEEPLVRTRPSEGSDVTLDVPDELVFRNSNEGAGMTPEVLDEPSDYSSSSSSNSKFGVEDSSCDEAEVTKKANNAKIVDAKKDTKDQVAEE
ncbi:hypothetical protein Tco_0281739 [Tanacetum coccineum]